MKHATDVGLSGRMKMPKRPFLKKGIRAENLVNLLKRHVAKTTIQGSENWDASRCVLKSDEINCTSRYVWWNPYNMEGDGTRTLKLDTKITLDGDFSAEELEAYAWWMRNVKQEVPDNE